MTILDFYEKQFGRLESLFENGYLDEPNFNMLWGRLLESLEEVYPKYDNDSTILVEDDE